MPNPLDQYLVGLRRSEKNEAALLGFQQVVVGRDDARIISARPGGPLVVQLSERAFEQLAEQFADDLIIEPDAPLTYWFAARGLAFLRPANPQLDLTIREEAT